MPATVELDPSSSDSDAPETVKPSTPKKSLAAKPGPKSSKMKSPVSTAKQRSQSQPATSGRKPGPKSRTITDFFDKKEAPNFYEGEPSTSSSSKTRSRGRPPQNGKPRSTGTDSESVASDTTSHTTDDRSSHQSSSSVDVVLNGASASTSAKSSTSSGATPKSKSRKKHRAPDPPKLKPSRSLPTDVSRLEIERIIDRWVGPSDCNDEDTFYLPKFKGFDAPDWNDNDAWVHVSQLMGPNAAEEIRKCDERKDQEAEKKRQRKLLLQAKRQERQPKWVYVDDDEGKNKEWDSVEERARREALADDHRAPKTREHRPVKYKEAEDVKPRRAKDDTEVPDEPYGFERGLEPEVIIGAHVYREQLVYLMKFKGSKTPNFVTEDECRKKCPSLVIKFLEEGLIKALHEKY